MASEAKGQVGGLDMNNESRKKLADESRHWQCSGCGTKSNKEIIADLQIEWNTANPDGAGESSATKIPEELRLAYKDDMERGPPTPGVALNSTTDVPSIPSSPSVSRVPSLPPRAGPVATILARSKPPPSPLRATASASGVSRQLRATQEPGTSGLQPTSTPALRSALATAPPMTAMSPPATYRVKSPRTPMQESMVGVPQWLDIMIFVIGILLALFAVGKVFG